MKTDVLHTNEVINGIQLNSILYLQSKMSQTFLHSDGEPPKVIKKSLNRFIDELEHRDNFIRIGANHLLNKKAIEEVYFSEPPLVIVSNGDILKVSESHSKKFLNSLL